MPSTVRRRDRPWRLPSFVAIAQAAGVLAAGLIREDLQADLALARVGKQPPSSTPTSLPVRTEAVSQTNGIGAKQQRPGEPRETDASGELLSASRICAIDSSRPGPVLVLDHKQFPVRHLCETASTTCNREPDVEVRRRTRIGIAEVEVNQPVAGPPVASLPARARRSSAPGSCRDGRPRNV